MACQLWSGGRLCLMVSTSHILLGRLHRSFCCSRMIDRCGKLSCHTNEQHWGISFEFVFYNLPSVLWRCWLGGMKGIRPVKKCGGVLAWLSVWSEVMPLPLTVSCFSKIQIGFTFLVPAHLGSSRKRAVKWVCVFVLYNVFYNFLHLF